jgi:hypothetical protein
MTIRDVLFLGFVLAVVTAWGTGVLRSSMSPSSIPEPARFDSRDLDTLIREVNASFRSEWSRQGLSPAPRASDLVLLRRLSLALTGTIPALEEIRRFESLTPDARINIWLDQLLRDRRSADYLAERFARAFVGVEEGPFIQFRRRLFVTWLSDAFHENRPYDAIVRDLVADSGIWTDHPATNFVSVTFDPEVELPDPERLAARVARSFLGVRIDCARCHDHPFQHWKQADFRGLAAYFGNVHSGLRGIRDGELAYHPPDRKTKKPTDVEPRVPFQPELKPTTGTLREQLAGWIVHPGNSHFAKATVNRVWALMYGKALVEPVDDLASAESTPPALDRLARDFSEHGYDLHRLIRVLARIEPFRVDSGFDTASGEDSEGPGGEHVENWASFPMTRMRPEQVAGAIIQAGSVRTISRESPLLVRLGAYTKTNDFVKRYGDAGEEELAVHCGTIPQELLMLNGDLIQDSTKEGLFSASSRIASLAPNDLKAVEVAYLSVLTRRPSPEEARHFTNRLAEKEGPPRKDRLSDLFWTLMNATEFSWNH